MRRPASLVLLLGFESGAVLVLHRLGDLPWLRLPTADAAGWVASNPPVETIAALLRPIALAAAVWVLASTILYAAARISGGAVAGSVARLTVPAIRRLVDRALLVGVSAMIAAGPSAAVALPSPLPHLATGSDEQPADRPTPAVVLERLGRTGDAHGDTGDGVGGRDEPATYLVRRGDNLWSIAARHVESELDEPGPTAIARYWRRLIAVNERRLRSGDPDLIYPEEIIELPPLVER